MLCSSVCWYQVYNSFLAPEAVQTEEVIVDPVEERFDNIEVILGRIVLENDRGMKRLDRLEEMMERAERRAEEDRKRAEEDRKRAEEDRGRAEEDRKTWNRKWGDLANKMGTLVEDIVAPNLPRVAKESLGCKQLDDFMIRRWVRNKKDPSKRREFDLIAVCGDRVIIGEVKSNPAIEYIDAFLKVLPELGDYFPEYRGKTLVPVFSSLYLGEDVVNYLTRHGVYALAMGDENMVLINLEPLAKTAPRIL